MNNIMAPTEAPPPRDFRVELVPQPQFIVADALKFVSEIRAKCEYATLLAAKYAQRDGVEL